MSVDEKSPPLASEDYAFEERRKLKEEWLKYGNHSTTVLEQDFVVFEGVFTPTLFPSSTFFCKAFPFQPGKSFLEVGCGAGILANIAAQKGCHPVLATDINPKSVENAKENARLKGVSVETRVSDIYNALGPREKFDQIFWNHPFGRELPVTELDVMDIAMHDVGYEALDRYIGQARAHLRNPSSGLFLGTSKERSDFATVDSLMTKYGWKAKEVAAESFETNGVTLTHSILALTSDL